MCALSAAHPSSSAERSSAIGAVTLSCSCAFQRTSSSSSSGHARLRPEMPSNTNTSCRRSRRCSRGQASSRQQAWLRSSAERPSARSSACSMAMRGAPPSEYAPLHSSARSRGSCRHVCTTENGIPLGSETCISEPCSGERTSSRICASPTARQPTRSIRSMARGSSSSDPKFASDHERSSRCRLGVQRTSQRAPAVPGPSISEICSERSRPKQGGGWPLRTLCSLGAVSNASPTHLRSERACRCGQRVSRYTQRASTESVASWPGWRE
mmetsp:Transcript_38881/g.89986  ORF Transcript_38881/g.89986 Transcript_38881/m.89986 type:complete len:269 (-) Transcript_38881:544-1350(-)